MKKVQLADRLGNVQNKKVGFSWLHFFFAPIHAICLGFVFTALLELFLYYMLLPIPGMEFIVELIGKIPFIPAEVFEYISKILLYFRHFPNYILGIIFVLLFHLYTCANIMSRKLKRYMKRKQLRPLEEKDARLLIKYHVCNVDVGLAESFDIRGTSSYKSAEENWYEKNQNRISQRPTFETRNNLRYTSEQKLSVKIEQLKNIYALGLITKEEYNRRLKQLKEENK